MSVVRWVHAYGVCVCVGVRACVHAGVCVCVCALCMCVHCVCLCTYICVSHSVSLMLKHFVCNFAHTHTACVQHKNPGSNILQIVIINCAF